MSDIVFVVVDAARPDAVGHLGSPGDPTPTIDALADRGISFPNAYSCINTTDPSLTSIHTGCYPATTGLVHHGEQVTRAEAAGIEDRAFLPEMLAREGYDTAGVDWLGRWHTRGFDYYTGQGGIHQYAEDEEGDDDVLDPLVDAVNANRDRIPQPIIDALQWGYRRFVHSVGEKSGVEDAETTTDRAIDLIDRTTSPRYLFVHYWDVHAPYETPEEYVQRAEVPDFDVDGSAVADALDDIRNDDRRRYIEEILDGGLHEALKQYYGAMSYVDDQLDRLFAHLADDTYVVVMADHGESLYEHGIFFEHHGLYEKNTRVPLVIAGPGVPDTEPTEGFAQLCDVMPTILGRLGIDPGDVDGVDLFDRIERGVPLRESVFLEEAQTQRKRAVRTDRYRYIKSAGDGVCSYCEIQHGERKMLFDLDEDPEETTNIAPDYPTVVANLERQLTDFFEARTASEREAVRRALASVVESDRM